MSIYFVEIVVSFWYGGGTTMENIVYFSLRIDEILNEKLIVISKEEGRSKNSEIEYILKQYVKKYECENGEIAINREE